MTQRLDTKATKPADLASRLKNVKKLIKYLEGLSTSPHEHRERLEKTIEHLKRKVNADNIDELYTLQLQLNKELEALTKREHERTYLEHLQGWYLRPLLSHFDSDKKIGTFISNTEGAGGLKEKLQLFVPGAYYKKNKDDTINALREFHKFKAHGKGTEKSRKLEQRFYEHFNFVQDHPLPDTTIGRLDMPIIAHNITKFWELLFAGKRSMIVTGLCPISTIADELGLRLEDGKVVRPTIGFAALSADHQNVVDLAWPNKPIIGDYLAVRYALELYQYCHCQAQADQAEISVIIWLPNHEYFLDLTENIFKDYLAAGIIEPGQIRDGLKRLTTRYLKLIEYVKAELGLDIAAEEDAVKIIEVNKNEYDELEKIKAKIDLSFFKNIYGAWSGNTTRRNLYEQLIIKHIQPVFSGFNSLHLDTSYELWLDLLGARVIEQNALPGSFSWLVYPSMPAVSLSHMREYNAPFDDKIYLADDSSSFQERLNMLSKKYKLNIAPLVIGKKKAVDQTPDEIIRDLELKLSALNEHFHS